MRKSFAAFGVIVAGLVNYLFGPFDVQPKQAEPVRALAATELPGQPVAERTIIVTIPDPIRTGLPLQFDRWIESIDRAASSQGYVFETWSIPWLQAEKSERAKSFEQPGRLQFRRASGDGRLTVFLVAESPTRGVDRVQLKAAVEANGKLEAIVGPSFSGSYQSLKEVLPTCKWPVISGSATRRASVEAFRRACSPSKPKLVQSTVEADSTGLRRLYTYFLERASFGNAAVLGETGTLYGMDRQTIAFPRDLSLLRAAYESDPALKRLITGAMPNSSPGVAAKADPESSMDTVAVTSPGQTVASRDALLWLTASSVNDRDLRQAVVRATNPLDIIFLRQFFAQQSPNLHFFLQEPDILFARAAESTHFTGTLAVSKYPLLSDQGLDPRVQKDGLFASKAAHGVFRATQLALNPKLQDQLQDYLWVTIVGRGGYWPVARLAEEPTDFSYSSPRFYSICLFLLVVTLSVCVSARFIGKATGSFLARIHKGETDGQPGGARTWLAAFYLDPAAPLYWARAFFASAFLLCLAVTVAVLLLPAIAASRVWTLALIVPFAGLLASWHCVKDWSRAAKETKWADWIHKDIACNDQGITIILGSLTLFVIAAVVVAIGLGMNDREYNRVELLAYRAIHVESGVSPVVPVALLLLSIAAYCWHHLQRFNRAASRFVPLHLPNAGVLEGPYERVRDLTACYASRLSFTAALVTAAAIIIANGSDGVSLSIEGRPFNALVIGLLALSGGLGASAAVQFVQTWKHLAAFHRALIQTPLRRLFTELPVSLGSVALFRPQGASRSQLYMIRERDCLVKLSKTNPSFILDLDAHVKTVCDSIHALEVRAGRDERETAADAYNAQTSLQRVTGLVFAKLNHVWGTGDSVLNGDKGDPLPKDVQLASELVALRFLAFLRYTMLQFRNILAYLSMAFILQTMALSSYPFLPSTLIRTYIAAGFIFLACTVGVVLWQISRDDLLNLLASDPQGHKDKSALWNTIESASLPSIAFLGTYFPALGKVLFSWIYPALSKLQQ